MYIEEQIKELIFTLLMNLFELDIQNKSKD